MTDKTPALEALKACPFCGSESRLEKRDNPMSKWKWSVDCTSTTCGMSGPVEASAADARAAWNTRAALQPVSAEPVAWAPVVGYEQLYEISNAGDLRSFRTNKVSAKCSVGAGYVKAELWKNGLRKQTTIHRLVAYHFVPNPRQLMEVNHKDGNKTNNSFKNLEWVTRVENCNHSRSTLGNGVSPVVAIDKVSGEEQYFPSMEEAGRNGYFPQSIKRCIDGIRKSHRGKTWHPTKFRAIGSVGGE